MKKTLAITALTLCAVVLIGCAAGPNAAVHTFDSQGKQAGFWLGIWHGMISPITFIISLFNGYVHFYEIHNNGGWYDFGFLCGAGVLFGGSTRNKTQRGPPSPLPTID